MYNLSNIIISTNQSLSRLKSNIEKSLIDLDKLLRPEPSPDLIKEQAGFVLEYAGFELEKGFYIDPDHLIDRPDLSPGSSIVIRDYTQVKRRSNTKNLFSPETGRFGMIHIPNLVGRFIEDNQHIFECGDEEIWEHLDRRKFNRTSKDIRDRFVDMFNIQDLGGISEDETQKVLELDLRKRLWECVQSGNNTIDDIYRVLRRYEGFSLYLPGADKFLANTVKTIEIDRNIELNRNIDQDGFNWEIGKFETLKEEIRR